MKAQMFWLTVCGRGWTDSLDVAEWSFPGINQGSSEDNSP